jgi:TPP-dependent pyruvate/acetoin dehydrogenase alpha subunit
LPIIIVEGSDSVAILRVIQECARRARQGHGPALIQCTRPSADPLEFLEEYLRKRNLWSDVWLERLEVEIRQASDKLKKTQV